MKNKDLIIKTARRLDKFTFDDVIPVAEIEEQEEYEYFLTLSKEQQNKIKIYRTFKLNRANRQRKHKNL